MQQFVKNQSQAMKMVKKLDVINKEHWSGDYRKFGRRAVAVFLQCWMIESIADLLSHLPDGPSDRRNGSYKRHLLIEIGDILHAVPRTKTYKPAKVPEACAYTGAFHQEDRGSSHDDLWQEDIPAYEQGVKNP